VITTRNEARYLPACLASVAAWADEIVVVDLESTDDSVAIAARNGAKIYHHTFVPYVELIRNFALSKAKGPWVLVLDPDEEVAAPLAVKLQEIVRQNPEASYFRLPRKNIIFGQWIRHSRWWPDYIIRFFKKGAVTWNPEVHGIPLTKGIGADLEAMVENGIIHHHYDSLGQYILRMDRYADARLAVLKKDGYRFLWSDLLKKPADEFFSRYFFGEGYRDGFHGLVLALLQAMSEFVVYGKAWEKEKFPEPETSVAEVNQCLHDLWSDYRYWEAEAALKTPAGLAKKLRSRVARKLFSKNHAG
jgi:(heptosyl)LPS beta-1,4-glucosyltransferase